MRTRERCEVAVSGSAVTHKPREIQVLRAILPRARSPLLHLGPPSARTAGEVLSRDPIGYGGGYSPFLYSGGKPTSVTDPSGTISMQHSSEGEWRCGGDGGHRFRIKLDSDAPCDGYVVQLIIAVCYLKNCDSGKWVADVMSWWEAMKVPKGQPAKRYWGDLSSHFFEQRTCGFRFRYATLRFYCRDRQDQFPGSFGTGDLDNNPLWKNYVHRSQCDNIRRRSRFSRPLVVKK